MWVSFNLKSRVPEDHPLRPIKRWCDRVLAGMSRDFNRAYSQVGRPGIIGWMRTTGTQARTRFIGRRRIELDAQMAAAAYNLLRMTWLLAPT